MNSFYSTIFLLQFHFDSNIAAVVQFTSLLRTSLFLNRTLRHPGASRLIIPNQVQRDPVILFAATSNDITSIEDIVILFGRENRELESIVYFRTAL